MYGAIKSLDNLANTSSYNVMDFRGDAGQGVDYIKLLYRNFKLNNSTRFKIDSSGRISKPNQPAFSVRRNSAQDIPLIVI